MTVISAEPVLTLIKYLRDKHNITTFVETGTNDGDSAECAATLFRAVITIEKDPNKVKAATRRLLKYGNVRLCEGDSRNFLMGVTCSLPAPALFWLDAHAIDFQNDDCPLLDELDHINGTAFQHWILIDDAHCFTPEGGRNPDIWPRMEQILARAEQGGYAMFVAHDIIVLVPEADAAEVQQVFVKNQGRRWTFNKAIQVKARVESKPDSYTEILDTAYGKMLVPRFDTNQVQPLRRNGKAFSDTEFPVLRDFLVNKCHPNPVFFDIGANIGTYSFALRPYCSKVYAFEAQRILYNMLCGSIALNSWENVFAFHAAVGAAPGTLEIPQFDYWKPCSFGSIEFTAEQQEILLQKRQHDPGRFELAPVVTLDSFNVKRADLLKIDVEGMERAVIAGAVETIKRCRPFIIAEFCKSDATRLRTQIEDLGYTVKYQGLDLLCTPMPVSQGASAATL